MSAGRRSGPSGEIRAVLHTVGGLHVGGVGNLLLRNLGCLDPARFRSQVCYFRPRHDLLPRFRPMGIEPIHIGYRGYWWLPVMVGRLLRLARTLRADLIHANHGIDHLVAGMVGAISGIPVIRTLHHIARPERLREDDAKDLPRRWIKKGTNRWLTDHFIAVSESVAEAHTRFSNVPADRMTVIYPGMASEDWRAPNAERVLRMRKRLGLEDAFPVLVNVGRLRPIKRQHHLIGIMRDVVASWPRARLLIVGEGDSRARIEGEIRWSGLQSHVQLLGSRDDVREILAVSDIFVMMSDREGFGLSMVEAMLAGLPVVCSRTDAATEIVESGVTGYIASDQEAIVRRVLELAADPRLARRIGEAGRASAARRFDLERSVRALEDTYERVLGR